MSVRSSGACRVRHKSASAGRVHRSREFWKQCFALLVLPCSFARCRKFPRTLLGLIVASLCFGQLQRASAFCLATCMAGELGPASIVFGRRGVLCLTALPKLEARTDPCTVSGARLMVCLRLLLIQNDMNYGCRNEVAFPVGFGTGIPVRARGRHFELRTPRQAGGMYFGVAISLQVKAEFIDLGSSRGRVSYFGVLPCSVARCRECRTCCLACGKHPETIELARGLIVACLGFGQLQRSRALCTANCKWGDEPAVTVFGSHGLSCRTASPTLESRSDSAHGFRCTVDGQLAAFVDPNRYESGSSQ